jgi:hypothetical protein
MATVEWTALPTLWPQPAVSDAVGSFELLVFTQDGVPTWEVRHNPKIAPTQSFDLVTAGTADSFESEGGSSTCGIKPCVSRHGRPLIMRLARKFSGANPGVALQRPRQHSAVPDRSMTSPFGRAQTNWGCKRRPPRRTISLARRGGIG